MKEIRYEPFRTDEELDEFVKNSVRSELKRKEIMKEPIAKYDREKKQAYLLFPDGTKKIIEGRR